MLAMKSWSRILLAAWLALAVLAGQQLVVLHELGHAADRIAHKDADTHGCKLHFACSQLAAAAGGKASPTLPVAAGTYAQPLARTLAAGAAPLLAFHSRGPPIPFA
jgi:hypothetical protein